MRKKNLFKKIYVWGFQKIDKYTLNYILNNV